MVEAGIQILHAERDLMLVTCTLQQKAALTDTNAFVPPRAQVALPWAHACESTSAVT